MESDANEQYLENSENSVQKDLSCALCSNVVDLHKICHAHLICLHCFYKESDVNNTCPLCVIEKESKASTSSPPQECVAFMPFKKMDEFRRKYRSDSDNDSNWSVNNNYGHTTSDEEVNKLLIDANSSNEFNDLDNSFNSEESCSAFLETNTSEHSQENNSILDREEERDKFSVSEFVPSAEQSYNSYTGFTIKSDNSSEVSKKEEISILKRHTNFLSYENRNSFYNIFVEDEDYWNSDSSETNQFKQFFHKFPKKIDIETDYKESDNVSIKINCCSNNNEIINFKEKSQDEINLQDLSINSNSE